MYDEVEHQRLRDEKIKSALKELEKVIKEACK